jgi:hypothetical protein
MTRASVTSWMRENPGKVGSGLLAVFGAVAIVTGARVEWGGDRVSSLEQRVTKVEQLQEDVNLLVVSRCLDSTLTREMFTLFRCHARLQRVNVEPPR